MAIPALWAARIIVALTITMCLAHYMTAHNIPPTAKPESQTVDGIITGNELEIPKLIPSVVTEYKKYRRVKP